MKRIAVLVSVLLFGLAVASCGTRISQSQIVGTFYYSGTRIGTIYLTAQGANTSNTTSNYEDGNLRAASYQILVPKGTYIVSAYLDVNGDSKQNPDEPSGFYDEDQDGKPDEVTVNVITQAANVTLNDH